MWNRQLKQADRKRAGGPDARASAWFSSCGTIRACGCGISAKCSAPPKRRQRIASSGRHRRCGWRFCVMDEFRYELRFGCETDSALFLRRTRRRTKRTAWSSTCTSAPPARLNSNSSGRWRGARPTAPPRPPPALLEECRADLMAAIQAARRARRSRHKGPVDIVPGSYGRHFRRFRPLAPAGGSPGAGRAGLFAARFTGLDRPRRRSPSAASPSAITSSPRCAPCSPDSTGRCRSLSTKPAAAKSPAAWTMPTIQRLLLAAAHEDNPPCAWNPWTC